MNITIGADPELFLKDAKGNFISAVGLIGGSKTKPLPIGEGCAIQEDNVAVEFNIAPAESVDAFVNSLNYALEELTDRALKMGLSLSITASASFPESQLMTPAACVFGCEPDYNCWTGKENSAPRSSDPNQRTTGGHVHIGAKVDRIQLARWCDVKLGLYSVLEDSTDGAIARRALYGKAGAFRPKAYGIEYRTLSPYWLSTQKLMKSTFWRARLAAKMVEEGKELSDKDGIKIQEAINNGNKVLAEELIKHYGGAV